MRFSALRSSVRARAFTLGNAIRNCGAKTMAVGTFELKALYAALDAKRHNHGLSWARVMREMAAGRAVVRRSLAPSTVTGLRTKTIAEGDGVLQMLRWLDRSLKSFVPECPQALLGRSALPDAEPREVLRFDTRKLYEALETQRTTRGIT
jgi:hypothetical protein